jgi:squalene cyclase
MNRSHRHRVPFTRGVAIALCIATAVSPYASAQPVVAAGASEKPTLRGDEITPALEQSVARGMEWLARGQRADGSFDGAGADSAITALAAIAFMADGNLPGRGKYGSNVQRALDFVLGEAQESGLLAARDSNGAMYAHGFATLFLAEVYGMTGDPMVKERLQKAVRLIHQAQNAQGGWRYTPQPIDADVSVTICQVMALRAARDAGIKVEKATIDRAIEYVKKCQNADGGFSYMLGQGGGSIFPRSAAGVATLYYAGVQDGPEITKGVAYIEQFLPGRGGANNELSGHYYYGHYYAVQSMFLAGGEHWAKWFPAIREELLRKQDPRGNWAGDNGEAYATSMALIILQMPKRYLPVFSGKGRGS